MWLLIVEMAIALALLAFIVWWVAFPSRKPTPAREQADADDPPPPPPP